MYERKETITVATGTTMVTFFTTLTEEEYSIYQQIVEDEFIQKAVFYENTMVENGVVSYSIWETKEIYDSAVATVNSLCTTAFNKTVDDYYSDTSKFTRVVEENEI